MASERYAERVVISQDERQLTVDAAFTSDTETGRDGGWMIAYQLPEAGGGGFDEARPIDVVAAGGRGTYWAWRRVGRRQLGVGIGAPPAHW
jgi:hypothetical protein